MVGTRSHNVAERAFVREMRLLRTLKQNDFLERNVRMNESKDILSIRRIIYGQIAIFCNDGCAILGLRWSTKRQCDLHCKLQKNCQGYLDSLWVVAKVRVRIYAVLAVTEP